ncbi:MAG: hypothetical protein KME26_11520 [Oscillatoria princeps RMCB-10]|nr:hypothetical protein [Oscillatoria princeps RMCB-10]
MQPQERACAVATGTGTDSNREPLPVLADWRKAYEKPCAQQHRKTRSASEGAACGRESLIEKAGVRRDRALTQTQRAHRCVWLGLGVSF